MNRYKYWIGAFAGIVLYLAVSTGILLWKMDSFMEPPGPKKPTALEVRDAFWNFQTPKIEELIKELERRLASVSKREADMDLLEKRLQLEKEELAFIRKTIEESQAAISRKIFEVKENEQKNLKKLASAYSNITPEAVVGLINEMEDSLAVKIMTYMSPDALGPIFQSMSMAGKKEPRMARRAVIFSDYLRLNSAAKKEEQTQP